MSSLVARDGPVLGHDVDPGLAGLETHGFAAGVTEREDVEDVGSRPRDVLALAVAEDCPVARPDDGHVELRVPSGIESEVGCEVALRLDDDDVLRGDRLASRATDVADSV